MKPRALSVLTFGLAFALPLAAQDTQFEPRGGQIPGPHNPTETNEHCCAKGGERPTSVAEWKSWIADLRHWRTEHVIRIGYDGSEYDRPELKWTQSSFIQPQMMAHDRFFYDPMAGAYTVQRYLDDLKRRYGGIDSVLVWPTYPNIGVDDRNQFDLIRDMPGGVQGLKGLMNSTATVYVSSSPTTPGILERALKARLTGKRLRASWLRSEQMESTEIRWVPCLTFSVPLRTKQVIRLCLSPSMEI